MSDEFHVSLALGSSLQDSAMYDGFLVRLAFPYRCCYAMYL